MTGEREILVAILRRLELLLVACDEDESALGSVPRDLAALAAMTKERRIAARALLKTVEQLQDQLARLFRLLPKIMLVDVTGWYAQDYANFAEKIGILKDGLGWGEIVRLRNRLVHDYPLEPEGQINALVDAAGVIPVLRAAATAARFFVASRGLAS